MNNNTAAVQIEAGSIVRKGNGKTEYRVVKIKDNTYPSFIDGVRGPNQTYTEAALVKATTTVIPKRFVWVGLDRLTKI